MNTTKHEHRAVASRETGYGPHPGDSADRTPAIGGITITEKCACGATRAIHRNFGWAQMGDWWRPSIQSPKMRLSMCCALLEEKNNEQ